MSVYGGVNVGEENSSVRDGNVSVHGVNLLNARYGRKNGVNVRDGNLLCLRGCVMFAYHVLNGDGGYDGGLATQLLQPLVGFDWDHRLASYYRFSRSA